MTRFRPCIDLHNGDVKQIVGGTLGTSEAELKTNFTSTEPSAHYAELYHRYRLSGAHIIMLGPGNDKAAKDALAAWRAAGAAEAQDKWSGEIQVGGGIKESNAREWIENGADKVIITSALFPDNIFSMERLKAILEALDNDKNKLVIDLSCRRKDDKWFVATNKWQVITEFELTQESISLLEPYCSEFLIHAADVEGLQRGIDHELVSKLAKWCSIPVTYAGGGRSLEDLELVKKLSNGKVDLTIGSALDIFGGSGVKFEDCVKWNEEQEKEGA
ncbi:Histidine biosynthesis bifunctional protein hisB [Paraphaeosphaeria sporulosa]|uniref:1-(5-phosphoribosyl)-5-[(5-phosphoribosylamino)methylideneamino] imidazole-4-carboxamide isomerase n=1 Tax=Paraphaeosphaeria sporulosa TaxID=1460663 RepID=A0A177CR60_9PLEO|nr:Phosphoribosylformimino-5-aminoimidazole carboxamide ribotide isomerase [Paraphaeosphaeria sporulosa]OAG09259.1 Phosphoribosylformimino-5-aminoimidazole carboxamide ribotide isomerase [Paraphaeosphaeria sporulosa]